MLPRRADRRTDDVLTPNRSAICSAATNCVDTFSSLMRASMHVEYGQGKGVHALEADDGTFVAVDGTCAKRQWVCRVSSYDLICFKGGR